MTPYAIWSIVGAYSELLKSILTAAGNNLEMKAAHRKARMAVGAYAAP